MSDKTVHSWKAAPEDEAVLTALWAAGVERSESAMVRAGLRVLAKKHGVKVA
jgi:hypothetical protein